jgi:hypothetical protein
VSEVAAHYVNAGTPVIATLLDCSKAFDKCEFVHLFRKLLDRKLPSVVVRMLIYIYTEQEAWVRWGSEKSSTFRITNGTRQGSVLSPALFCVYLDDLIKELRKLGLGCHMAGLWIGAVGFADDLLLLAPSRGAMAKMLETCELYATEHNLQFSTDPSPEKSKSKCIYMTGTRLRNRQKPAALCLYGVELPWVVSATHLGHDLHQDANLDFDCKCKRGRFIQNSTNVRETFRFAEPAQMLRAVKVYCCDFYGSMLWDLFGNQAQQMYRTWNTCVKLAWDVPRSTHTFFVDGLLGSGLPSIRQQILGRYPKFFKSLLDSPSLEVAVVARIVSKDAKTITGKNLLNLRIETGVDVASAPLSKSRQLFSLVSEPTQANWKFYLLEKYLKTRNDMDTRCEDTEYINDLISSLCSS